MTSHIGEKFGTLTVIGVHYQKYAHTKVICECDCGCNSFVEVEYFRLVSGHTKSCGGRFHAQKRLTIDELKYRRFKCIYKEIVRRCNSPKSTQYKYYGGRGIKCLWNSFDEFKNDMYDLYVKHCDKYGEYDTTIDRCDYDGNYCKENCRWATHIEQGNNTRRNHYITIDGITKTAREWWRECGVVAYGTFMDRMAKFGWDPLKALTTPPKPTGNNVHKKG